MRLAQVTFFALLACGPSWAETHTVPLDIRDYFSKSECSEILDYYSDAGVIEKPYSYGIKSFLSKRDQANDLTFIAWCKSKSSKDMADHQYMLVGRLDGASWPGGCKFPVQGFDYPGGISISIKKIPLKSFVTFSLKQAGSGMAKGPIIQSERDGLVYEVFCHNGNWIKRNID